jgi:ribosome-binding factor A
MSSRRVLKAAEAIREVVSMAILRDLRDPRIEHVTVTAVTVSPDMRQAKVYVSVMGEEPKQKLCLYGLQSSAGFLQSKISDRIDTRYTPKLIFELDQGVKKSIAIAKTLAEVLGDKPLTNSDADATESPGDEPLHEPHDEPHEDDET